MKTIWIPFVAIALGGYWPVSTPQQGAPQQDAKKKDAKKSDPAKQAAEKDNAILLFDGKSLKNWKKTSFGGEGEVTVEKGLLILERGEPLTGVTWTGDALPKTNYEVTLEAKLIEGFDFFCGIGFPVGETSASFVAGGWGGSVCGISTIDGDAAIDNNTCTVQTFKKDQWYEFCLRVTPENIEVWLGDEQIVDVKVKDHKIAIHPSMEPSVPFGLTSYMTTAAYRNVKLRKLEKK